MSLVILSFSHCCSNLRSLFAFRIGGCLLCRFRVMCYYLGCCFCFRCCCLFCCCYFLFELRVIQEIHAGTVLLSVQKANLLSSICCARTCCIAVPLHQSCHTVPSPQSHHRSRPLPSHTPNRVYIGWPE